MINHDGSNIYLSSRSGVMLRVYYDEDSKKTLSVAPYSYAHNTKTIKENNTILDLVYNTIVNYIDECCPNKFIDNLLYETEYIHSLYKYDYYNIQFTTFKSKNNRTDLRIQIRGGYKYNNIARSSSTNIVFSKKYSFTNDLVDRILDNFIL